MQKGTQSDLLGLHCARSLSPVTVCIPLSWMRTRWRDQTSRKVFNDLPAVTTGGSSICAVKDDGLSWFAVEEISTSYHTTHAHVYTTTTTTVMIMINDFLSQHKTNRSEGRGIKPQSAVATML